MAASSAEQKGNASIFIVSDTLPPCKRKLKPWIYKWISQASDLLNHMPFPLTREEGLFCRFKVHF